MSEQASTQCAKQKSITSISNPTPPYFPPELLEHILRFLIHNPSHVPTAIPPSCPDLSAFASVCRPWRLASLPYRFRHVRLTLPETNYDERLLHFTNMDRFYRDSLHLGQLVRVVTIDMTVLRDEATVAQSVEGIRGRARELIMTRPRMPMRRLTMTMQSKSHQRRYSSSDDDDVPQLALLIHSVMQAMPRVEMWRLEFLGQKFKLSKTTKLLFETMVLHGVGSRTAKHLQLISLPKLYTVPPLTSLHMWIASLTKLESLEADRLTSRFFTLDLRHATQATQPPLQTLKITSLRFWDNDGRWLPFPYIPAHLTVVDITNTPGLMYGSRFLYLLSSNCPGLRELHTGIPGVQPSDTEMVSGPWEQNLIIFQEGIVAIAESCRALQVLDLASHREIPDEVLMRILAASAGLERLRMRGCEEMTGRKVRDVVCAGLKQLDVTGCHNLAPRFLRKIARGCAECEVVGDDWMMTYLG
ncbi:hypothetical protein BC937DRAFT_86846 [Endogone sp. FLAS-F59071]|nr:hypothetical protein BC937DRAFT_86846 [Endogone sp. FLAS-F59071]|eukprot:RUS19821.1 hypothetical protein BC937DRAFT_86846 [Endogone sp. FLAS-F59071]